MEPIDIQFPSETFPSKGFTALLSPKEKTWKEQWQIILDYLKEKESQPEYREPKP